MRNRVRVPRIESVVGSTPRHARKCCTNETSMLHHDLQCSDSRTSSTTSKPAPTMMVKVVGRNRARRGCERCRHDGWAQPRATCAMHGLCSSSMTRRGIARRSRPRDGVKIGTVTADCIVHSSRLSPQPAETCKWRPPGCTILLYNPRRHHKHQPFGRKARLDFSFGTKE